MAGEFREADQLNGAAIVRWLRTQLYKELSAPSFQRQFSRLVWFTLASYTAALAAEGWHFSLGSLWGLLPPAVWVAAEETWPTLPWKTITQYLDAAKTPPIAGSRISDTLNAAPAASESQPPEKENTK